MSCLAFGFMGSELLSTSASFGTALEKLGVIADMVVLFAPGDELVQLGEGRKQRFEEPYQVVSLRDGRRCRESSSNAKEISAIMSHRVLLNELAKCSRVQFGRCCLAGVTGIDPCRGLEFPEDLEELGDMFIRRDLVEEVPLVHPRVSMKAKADLEIVVVEAHTEKGMPSHRCRIGEGRGERLFEVYLPLEDEALSFVAPVEDPQRIDLLAIAQRRVFVGGITLQAEVECLEGRLERSREREKPLLHLEALPCKNIARPFFRPEGIEVRGAQPIERREAHPGDSF